MSKHQTCVKCHSDFVGPDGGIGLNYCPSCLGEPLGCPEDHPVLDQISDVVAGVEHVMRVSRESECIEFYDLEQDRWFEIVVRPIEEPS